MKLREKLKRYKMINKSKVKQIVWGILRNLVLPVWVWQCLKFKREANIYLKRIRAVQSLYVAIMYFGSVTLFVVYLPWSESLIESAIAKSFSWILINGIMNKSAMSVWGFPNFAAKVLSEEQVPLDLLPDVRTVRIAGSPRAKKKIFPLGVKSDGLIFWYSLTDFVDSYDVEPFHVALYGEHGMYREHVANMLLYRAIMVNVRRSYESAKWRLLKYVVPDIFVKYRMESNCVVLVLDDVDSGMSMQHLRNLPGVAIFTGRNEVKGAIAKLDQVCYERNERTADGNVSIFVLCDHSVASAFLGKNLSYQDLSNEMHRILVGGTKRKIKLFLIPPPNVTELIAGRANKANVRAFAFHSKFSIKVSHKGLEAEVVKLPTPPAWPSLAYISQPTGQRMEDVPVKIAHISPPLMRERLSKMSLTAAAQFLFNEIVFGQPSASSEGKKVEAEPSKNGLPSGITFNIEEKRYYMELPRGGKKIVYLVDGKFCDKRHGAFYPIKSLYERSEPALA